MGKRGLVVKSAFFVIYLFTIIIVYSNSVNGQIWCPYGKCGHPLTTGSAECALGSSTTCVGTQIYGGNSACTIGSTDCIDDNDGDGLGFWGDCIGWKGPGYADFEDATMCGDGLDNDCDGLVDQSKFYETVWGGLGFDTYIDSLNPYQSDESSTIMRMWAGSTRSIFPLISFVNTFFSSDFQIIDAKIQLTVANMNFESPQRTFLGLYNLTPVGYQDCRTLNPVTVTLTDTTSWRIRSWAGGGTPTDADYFSGSSLVQRWRDPGCNTGFSSLDYMPKPLAYVWVNQPSQPVINQPFNFTGLPLIDTIQEIVNFGNAHYVIIPSIQQSAFASLYGTEATTPAFRPKLFLRFSSDSNIKDVCAVTTSTTSTSTSTTTSSSSSTSSSSTSTSITTTSIGGGGGGSIGHCSDGVLNFGEQCDSSISPDIDCINLGPYDTCDVTGFVTGVRCSCYARNETGGPIITYFTTSCQDTGIGSGQGVRTETVVENNGGSITETSQQISCILPPINVPGFTMINYILTLSLIFGFYLIKRKN